MLSYLKEGSDRVLRLCENPFYFTFKNKLIYNQNHQNKCNVQLILSLSAESTAILPSSAGSGAAHGSIAHSSIAHTTHIGRFLVIFNCVTGEIILF